MALEKEHLREATQVPFSMTCLHSSGHLSLPGSHLCSATLQWLLAENAAVDVVRTQTLSSIQGIAPDGTDVNLIVHEASRGHLHVWDGTQGPQSSVGPWAIAYGNYFNWPVSLSHWEDQPCMIHHVHCQGHSGQ